MIELTKAANGEAFMLNPARITEIYDIGEGACVCTDMIVKDEQVQFLVKENVKGICFVIRRGA